MADQRVGGIIQVATNGVLLQAKGNWTYNIGRPKRDAVVGADTVHGYKEMPQAPFIEGEITDSTGLDLNALTTTTNATVVLNLAVGKTIVLSQAWYSAEGNVQTEEGNIQVKFEGKFAEEVGAV
jgi:hypothetical protein